jgi:ABC-2 type transport system permease protein
MDGTASAWRLARQETRLAWRDIVAMSTGNKPGRGRVVIVVFAALALGLHAIAWALVGAVDDLGRLSNDYLLVSGALVLPLALMTSQAMESVTRLFYSRSDLDLVLASPVPVRRIFATRLATIALTTAATALLLAAPAIHALAILDRPGWLATYPLICALALLGTVLSLWLTLFLFRSIGARRTRVIAQVVAAFVGAAFVIGIQIAAIGSMGSVSRIEFLTSEAVRAKVPDAGSILWLPARAASGEIWPLVAIVACALLLLWVTVTVLAQRFADEVLSAAGVAATGPASTRTRKFRRRSTSAALRQKEWKLLIRDPWLLSQTLMQVLYLAPPAFMLWQGFGGSGAVGAIVTPVVVMATGQLAGGLAWLAISGEDAPQLVTTAPVTPGAILGAKVEAVLGAVLFMAAPIVAGMALLDGGAAFVCLLGISAATISAIMIQMWFRSQSRRSNFRRRQTSSRIATFAEAFSSIFWAGAAGLLASGSGYWIVLAAGAGIVLVTVRAFAPRAAEFAG